jgi:SAM-dependent methyltransferase
VRARDDQRGPAKGPGGQQQSISLFDLYYYEYQILDLVGDVRGRDVLDAGCGNGRKAKELLARGAKVVGIDNDPQVVEQVRSRHPGVRVLLADLRQPMRTLDTHSFDLVVASLVLHYLRDWDGVLSEFHRVLRPAGRLVISIHHPFMDFIESGSFDYFATELWRFQEGGSPSHTHIFWRRPLTEVLGPLRRQGFRLEKMSEPLPAPTVEGVDSRVVTALSTSPRLLMLATVRS